MLSKKMKLVFVFLVLCVIAQANIVNYDGYKVYEVKAMTNEEISVLKELEEDGVIRFWSNEYRGKPFNVIVAPWHQNSFEMTMRYWGMPFQVLIHDVDELIGNESDTLMMRSGPSRRSSFNSIDLNIYNRYHNIQQFMGNIARQEGSAVTVKTIGQTFEGRDLDAIMFCRDGCNNKPSILIDCGIHAREWMSVAFCVYIIQQLAEDSNNSLLEKVDWLVIPVFNPDGYEYSHVYDRMWRKTRSAGGGKCKGVDPNRNFDFHWDESGTSRKPCSDIYSGAHAFTEPEAKAFRDFVSQHVDNLKLYLTFHSYGNYILYPWGYSTVLPSNVKELDDLGREVAAAIEAVRGTEYTVGTSANALYPAAGGSDDWVKGVGGVELAYTLELPGGGKNGFDPPISDIPDVLKETFQGIRVFHKHVEKKGDSH